MKEKENRPYPLDEMEEGGILAGGVVSSQECTGLIPSLPQTRGNVESYGDLYCIPESENSQTNDIMKMKSDRKKEKRS
jgi:hypothetical protein